MLTVAEDPALYSRVHRLVRELCGPASAQLCARCVEDGLEKQAHDWAQVHTEDGLDPWTDYVSHKGKHHSEETRAKMSEIAKGKQANRERDSQGRYS